LFPDGNDLVYCYWNVLLPLMVLVIFPIIRVTHLCGYMHIIHNQVMRVK